MAIGQGDVLVTPLQMAVATAALANGNKVIKPHLVKEVIDPVTSESKPKEAEILNQGYIGRPRLTHPTVTLNWW